MWAIGEHYHRIADTNHKALYRCPISDFCRLSPSISPLAPPNCHLSLARSHTHAHILLLRLHHVLSLSTPPSPWSTRTPCSRSYHTHKSTNAVLSDHYAAFGHLRRTPAPLYTPHTIYLMVGRESNRHRVGSQLVVQPFTSLLTKVSISYTFLSVSMCLSKLFMKTPSGCEERSPCRHRAR